MHNANNSNSLMNRVNCIFPYDLTLTMSPFARLYQLNYISSQVVNCSELPVAKLPICIANISVGTINMSTEY